MSTKLFIKYFLFIYLLAISGFEFFFRASMPALYLLFPFVASYFVYTKENIDIESLKIATPFFLVFLLQSIFYQSPVHYSFTLLIRLFTIYLAVKIIGIDYVKIFINTIKFIALYSIPFYILQYNNSTYDLLISICKNFTNLNSNPELLVERPNFIIYAIQTKDHYDLTFFRNSGPFFEPGLYVVFLNIALFLNLNNQKRILSSNNILLIISIVTAFSTTGFIALVVNLIFFTMSTNNLKHSSRVFIVGMLVLIIPFIYSLPFMKDKIETQIGQTDISHSRFGAAVLHYNIVKDFPISGMPASEELYATYSDHISPNGITVMFMTYGIIAGLIYYLLLFFASYEIMDYLGERKNGVYLFTILVVVIFSETQGNNPLYWSIIFSQIPISIFTRKRNILIQKMSIEKDNKLC